MNNRDHFPLTFFFLSFFMKTYQLCLPFLLFPPASRSELDGKHRWVMKYKDTCGGEVGSWDGVGSGEL